jgi:hypothetical protein
MRATHGLALLALICPALAAQQKVPLVLNHLVVTLDSATYNDILAAPFLREQFAAPEIGFLTGVDGGDGVRFFGKYNFIQFFGPKSFGQTKYSLPGDVVVALATERVGGLDGLKSQGHYGRGGAIVWIQNDGPVHANPYHEESDRLRLTGADSTSSHTRFEILQYSVDAAKELAAMDSLPLDNRTNSRFFRHNYDPAKLFAYLTGATLAVPVDDIAKIAAAMRRNNVAVTTEGDGAIIKLDGFTLHLIPPWTGAGVKQLQFALTHSLMANPTYRFGPRSQLRFGPGATAVWDFERQ